MFGFFKHVTFCKSFQIQWKILLLATFLLVLFAVGGGIALSLNYHLAESGKFPNTTSFTIQCYSAQLLISQMRLFCTSFQFLCFIDSSFFTQHA